MFPKVAAPVLLSYQQYVSVLAAHLHQYLQLFVFDYYERIKNYLDITL